MTTTLRWHERIGDALSAAWRARRAAAPDEREQARERYLAGSRSHEELERRIRSWDDAGRGLWW